ncbi:uncharacterized protein LOC144862672 isoform X7 [Branchiostoma floridae x Branchiostoma japonicum]
MAGGLLVLALLLLLGGSVPYVSSQECAGSTTNIALNRPATQSSTRYQGAAGRAVDGDVSPRYAENSCTHTAKESNPWWQVDLGKSQCVDRVVVTNRKDCCSERLEGFTVHVGDNPDVYKNPTCGGPQSVGGKKLIEVDCGGKTGRYVGISLKGSERTLTLCEVQVFGGKSAPKVSSAPPDSGSCAVTTTNIALNKKTTQSSTSYGGAAGRAVDGDVSPRYAENSCTHTAKESNPWWQVDLGKSQCVGRVVVTNREDCCSERLEGFTVHVGDNPDVFKNPTCGGPQSAGGKKLIEVDCGGKTGRYVGITLSGKGRILTLCEVQVFGGSSAAKAKSAPKVSSAPPDSGSCAVTTTNIALNKKTTQSSTSYGGAAGRAVDGDVSPRYAENSCTHTAKESNPWWQVDLGKSQCVGRVVVTNREDCCSERLEGFTVHVGDNPDVFKNPTCGGPQSAGGKKLIEVDCGGKTGRYVGITLSGKGRILTLCEVQVFGGSSAAKAKSAPKVSSAPPDSGSCAVTTTNIALNKKTTQSSTSYGGAAGRAVDGDVSPRYAENSCTHTAKESNPWWQVDLGKSQCVGRVVVTNREDCCSERLEGFTVHVGDNPDVFKNPTCGGPQSAGGKKLIEVDCGGKTGRYVGITLSGKGRILTLCEVQVFGGSSAAKAKSAPKVSSAPPDSGSCAVTTTNIALNKKTTQSSTRYGGAAGRAVDGDVSPLYAENSCTHTAKESNPWWQVDLGKSQCVGRVVVTNREDCCSERLEGFTVHVGDNPDVFKNPTCGGPQSAGGKKLIEVDCGGKTGRYVGITLKGSMKILTLCEVQVFGGSSAAKAKSAPKVSSAPPDSGSCAVTTTNIALNKKTTQSSTRYGGAAGRAVDGDVSPLYAENSCTHTAKESNPWWQVDLGKSQCVGRVVVTNREDCCSERLEGFTVHVGDNPDVFKNPTCGGPQSAGGKKLIEVDCGGKTGRYVGITLKGSMKILTLCEVQVFGGSSAAKAKSAPKVSSAPPDSGSCAVTTTNIALNKKTTQSSTRYGGAAGRAVDGDVSPRYAENSCTHTAKESNPWWQVDLGKSQCVGRVVVTNREDCCSERLEGFTVHVGDNPDVFKNPTCGGPQSAGGKKLIEVDCGGKTGRYVGITLSGKGRILTLCEVQVFGGSSAAKAKSAPKVSSAPPDSGSCAVTTTNIALNKKTTQSSTRYGGAAGRAVDGDVSPLYAENSCTHTAKESNPWWQVDLGKSQCVGRVVVTNREDCCSERLEGFTVHVGDNPDVFKNPTCGGPQSAGGKKLIEVDCGGKTGRYVGITLSGKRRILTLCEVQVFGGSSAAKAKSAPKVSSAPPDSGSCALTTTNIALNKQATQSSTKYRGAAGRAVDGDVSPRYAENSCTHTAKESNPWWQVDLGKSQCVGRVVVTNREDCCSNRLEGFTVYVGDNPDVYKNPTCGGPQSVGGKKLIEVDCGGKTGRYVGITLSGRRKTLTLCEVQVYGARAAPKSLASKSPGGPNQCAGSTTNIALKQQTTQSSTAFKGAPGRAVDGNRNAIYAQKSCSHTAMERNPWWRVDLGSSQCVDRVAVVKRQRCCGQWLEGFQVYVGDNPNVMENPKCGGLQSVKGKDVITVNCGRLTGRYVGIALPGKRQYLILCEVEVYGGSEAEVEKVEETGTSLALQPPKPEEEPPAKVAKEPPKLGQCAGGTTNIALKQQTTQSSTAFKGAPGRAVDGNRNAIYAQKSCSHTAMERNPWWRVDLGSSQCVDRVAVVKRQRCCGQWLEGFQVYVGDNPNVMENPKCGGLQSVEGKDVITVNCGGLTGRYVGIALPGKRQYLILCEVEVYGGSGGKVEKVEETGTSLALQPPKPEAPPAKVAEAPPKLGQCAASTTNIALNQQTTQSSTAFKGAPGRAVDGNRNAIYAQKSCSHTAMERNPWWRVDLGSSQCVDRVAVVKRQRCCGQWLEGFQVYVGDNPNVMENPKCGGLQSVEGKDVITVNCGGLTGRYVGIALPGKRQYLILCEVEVYGGSEAEVEKVEETGTSPALQPPKPEVPPAKIAKEPPKLGQCAGGTTNIALNQQTTQSSTAFKGAPGRAVDGNRNAIYAQKSCSHTAMERNPWWRVDLGSSQCVDRVAVVKRQRCCGQWLEGFQVYVGDNPNVMENPKCGGLQSVEGKDVITVNCGGLTGRYVGIALPGKRQYLILCEVEVYGGSEAKVEKVEETGTSLALQAPKSDPCKNAECQNDATCEPDGESFKCICPKGYAGTMCETNVDDCAANPCQNDGTCQDGVDGYTCICPKGFAGNLCETNVDDCADNPCQNEGTCEDGVDGFTCICPKGFAGNLCETNVDDCADNPCQNDGTCEDGVDGFTCICPKGFAGNLCETNVDDCADNPCQNDGTCQDGVDGFTCICPKGFAGNLCETNVDDCADNPCQNEGTCEDGVDGFTCICPKGFAGNLCETNVDDCADNPCQNEGTCQDGVDGFTCICPKGFAGNLCETNVDDCAANPCQNDGTCQDGVDGFTCICPTGFAGNLCETNIDNCTPNPCQNGGTCNDLVNAFLCSCKNGYGGNLCEIGPLPPPAPPAPKPKVQPAVQPKPAAGVIITIGGGNPGGSSGYAGDGAINVINNQISVYGKKGCGCTTPNCACPVKKGTDSSKADDLSKVVQQRLRGSVKQPEDDASNLNELDTVETVYEPVDNEMALFDDETAYEQEAREEQGDLEEQLEDDLAVSDDESVLQEEGTLAVLNRKLHKLDELLRSTQ